MLDAFKGESILTEPKDLLQGIYKHNCLNNKMLKSDWFSKALIYGLIWLFQHQNCPI